MTPAWFLVYDSNGVALAGFPERSLAESYSEGTNWEIREVYITFL